MRAIVCLAVLLLGVFSTGVRAMSENDPYSWLEDVHGTRPLAWVKEQNVKSLGLLKADPRYRVDYESILSVLDATDRIAYGAFRRDGFVYNFWQDAANPKGVWRRTTIADYESAAPHWQVLLDVDALAKAEKENWVWEGSACAPAGRRYCLIKLSRGGGDAKVIREFDLESKSFLKDGFTLPEAKSEAAYMGGDGAVLFAGDFGPGSLTKSGYPRIVKLWRRGRGASPGPVYEGKTQDVAVSPAVLGDTGETGVEPVALAVRAVSFFETEYYGVGPGGEIGKLPLPLSADVKGALPVRGPGGASGQELIVTLRESWTPPGGKTIAKGALFALPIHDGRFVDLSRLSVLFVPGPRQSIDQVAVGRDAVYAAIYDNVIGKVHVFRPKDGTWRDSRLALPGSGAADIAAVNDFGPQAMFNFQNYLTPPTLYFDDGDDRPRAIKSLPARFDAGGMVTEQFEATSRDGTEIPYFVTRPKTLNGPAPAILYGYGGFEVSLTPSYSANFGRLWLSKGGIYVVANIRGGGEFGPAWHDAALKDHRQRAFDDFEAVAEDLERRGLTTPKQLGIMGGSNGGLLVSTVMVQRPDLFGAVVCQVPLIDMLAYTHIGAGASWIGEYGDPADPKMRDYILRYSPYQNVKPDVKYPPVLFVTATSDDRVTPAHARKMAAKMEAQGHDVLFYENTDGGHAAAADHKQAAEMWALSFVYLAEKLGLK
jgi:prolyl oligopeptidase